jgi:uncharacterized protein YndB with AHSA1/START domain
MGSTAKATAETVEIRRTFSAPRQRVFDAWTRPEELAKWAAPGPMTCVLAEVDLRVGGVYRTHMRAPDGAEHRVTGVYRVVDPPKKLVYTWGWEAGSSPVKDSVVTVEFVDRGAATEVILRHAGLPDAQQRSSHEKGWIGCFEKFPAAL